MERAEASRGGFVTSSVPCHLWQEEGRRAVYSFQLHQMRVFRLDTRHPHPTSYTMHEQAPLLLVPAGAGGTEGGL